MFRIIYENLLVSCLHSVFMMWVEIIGRFVECKEICYSVSEIVFFPSVVCTYFLTVVVHMINESVQTY